MKSLTPFQKFAAAIVSCCLVATVAATSLLICQCETQPTTTTIIESEAEQAMMKSDEIGVIPFETENPTTGEIYTGVLYTHESEIGYEQLSEGFATNSNIVEQGFEFVLSRSKYITTSIMQNDRQTSVRILVLIFEKPTTIPSDRSYAIIRHTAMSGVKESLQLEKIFHGVDPWSCWTQNDDAFVSYLGYDEGPVWAQSFIPHITNPYASDPGPQGSPMAPIDSIDGAGPDAWNWAEFLQCVTTEAAVGCGVAAGVCLTSNDPYSDCVESGCSNAAMGAVISCTTEQLFPSGW